MKQFQINYSSLLAFLFILLFTYSASANEYGLIALSDDEVGLSIRGLPELSIEGGGIYVNSPLDNGLDVMGNPFSSGESLLSEINVVGGYDISDTVLGYLATANNGEPTILRTGVAPILDPLAYMPEPPQFSISPTAPADGSLLQILSGNHILEPGYYPGGIDITGGNITLSPGIYQIGSEIGNREGFSVIGGIVNAQEVMFHLLDGSVDILGNAQMILSPSTSGDYEGISIFQSRTNYNDSELNGGGGLDLTGKLYFPVNHLSLYGNGDTIGSKVIADTIEIGGNGLINIPFSTVPEPAMVMLLGLGGMALRRRRQY